MSAIERIAFGSVRVECRCENCVGNCECIPGYLIPDDLKRLIPHGVVSAVWAREHLRASDGTKIIYGGRVMQVQTLVPAHVSDGLACHWLKDGLCTVHAIAPFGCAHFDCKQSKQQADELSRQGIIAIMQDRAEGGLYARLWDTLQEEGLVAPDITVRKAALTARYEEYQHARRRRRPPSPLRKPHR